MYTVYMDVIIYWLTATAYGFLIEIITINIFNAHVFLSGKKERHGYCSII